MHVKDCCLQVFVSFVVVNEIFLGLGMFVVVVFCCFFVLLTSDFC